MLETEDMVSTADDRMGSHAQSTARQNQGFTRMSRVPKPICISACLSSLPPVRRAAIHSDFYGDYFIYINHSGLVIFLLRNLFPLENLYWTRQSLWFFPCWPAPSSFHQLPIDQQTDAGKHVPPRTTWPCTPSLYLQTQGHTQSLQELRQDKKFRFFGTSF